eukprot:4321871-Pleurochrysis_carterae.AAC.2
MAWQVPGLPRQRWRSITPLHYDRGNFGMTALVSFDVTGPEDDELRGGSHAFFDQDITTAFVLQDCTEGVLCGVITIRLRTLN